MDKPKRVMLLHVPVYEDDFIILNQAPPAAKGQWARALILRQLHIDAQMLHSFGDGGGEPVVREEVKRAIQDELEPILAKLDDTMDKVIDEKLAALQPAMIQAVQDSIQSVLAGHKATVTSCETAPNVSKDSSSEVNKTPTWQNALRGGTSTDRSWS